MLNTRVTIRAAGIEVTASKEDEALGLLREDGMRFRGSWEYELSGTSETDDDPEDLEELGVEAETTEPAGTGERTWIGDVLFTIVIAGSPSEDEALEAARAVVVG